MGDKSVAVYMFAQTVGVRPRQKSAAQRVCFCPQCAVSLAMGLPPEGALNMVAWEMIRDLVSSEPSLNEAAWESLGGDCGPAAAGKDESSGKYRRAGRQIVRGGIRVGHQFPRETRLVEETEPAVNWRAIISGPYGTHVLRT